MAFNLYNAWLLEQKLQFDTDNGKMSKEVYLKEKVNDNIKFEIIKWKWCKSVKISLDNIIIVISHNLMNILEFFLEFGHVRYIINN